jgi:hypothetical protein
MDVAVGKVEPGRWLPGLVFVLGALAACDGASAGFTSGLDRREVLSALDADEAAALCAGARSFMKKELTLTNDEICRFAGEWSVTFRLSEPPFESDEAVRMTCQQAYDSCTQRIANEPRTCQQSRECPKAPQRCEATVADLEACGSLLPAFWKDLFRTIPSCDQFSRAVAAARNGYQPRWPAACERLKSQCPDFQFEDDLFSPFTCL